MTETNQLWLLFILALEATAVSAACAGFLLCRWIDLRRKPSASHFPPSSEEPTEEWDAL